MTCSKAGLPLIGRPFGRACTIYWLGTEVTVAEKMWGGGGLLRDGRLTLSNAQRQYTSRWL